jgi:hypothetical protein
VFIAKGIKEKKRISLTAFILHVNCFKLNYQELKETKRVNETKSKRNKLTFKTRLFLPALYPLFLFVLLATLLRPH